MESFAVLMPCDVATLYRAARKARDASATARDTVASCALYRFARAAEALAYAREARCALSLAEAKREARLCDVWCNAPGLALAMRATART